MGAYIGLGGKAKAISKAYIGVPTRLPVYETTGEKVTITVDNISEYFTVTNSTYYFAGSNGTWTSNNKAVGSSTAQTVIALKSDGKVSFNYTCSSETNYDKLTITTTIGGTTTTRVNAVSGVTSGSLSYDMSAGDSITFKYVKDGSVNSNSDICTFSNLSHDTTQEVIVGYEEKDLAKKIKKIYVGKNGKAKELYSLIKLRHTLTEQMSISGYASIGTYASSKEVLNDKFIMSTKEGLLITESDLQQSFLTISSPRYGAATTVINGKMIISGGWLGDGIEDPTSILSVNDELTTSTISATTYSNNRGGNAESNGNYGVFMGGGWEGATNVFALSSTLTKSTLTSHSSAKRLFLSGHTDTYGIFAGGYGYSSGGTSEANAYNLNTLTKTKLSSLLSEKHGGGSASYDNDLSYKNKVIFAGGIIGGTDAAGTFDGTIEGYNNDLTKFILPYTHNSDLAYASRAVLDNYGIIAGEAEFSEIITDDLVMEKWDGLSNSGNRAMATVGGKVVILGTKSKPIEYYEFY